MVKLNNDHTKFPIINSKNHEQYCLKAFKTIIFNINQEQSFIAKNQKKQYSIRIDQILIKF